MDAAVFLRDAERGVVRMPMGVECQFATFRGEFTQLRRIFQRLGVPGRRSEKAPVPSQNSRTFVAQKQTASCSD